MLADFVASHAYDRHVRAARLRYGRRRERLVELLEQFRGLAELYQNPDEAGQGLLIGYAGPSEREYPAALEALAGTLRAVGF